MKIAISVVLALFLIGCSSDDTSKSSDSIDAQTKELKAAAQDTDMVADEPTEEDAVSDDAVNNMSDNMKDSADEMQDSTEDMSNNMKDSAVDMSDNMKDSADDMSDNMKDSSDKMTNSMKDSADSVADAASDSANSMADAMTGMMPGGDSSVSGKEIFKVCSTCHGMNAEKSALGKSKIIRGWDSVKIENALHGYKEGTYGGPMKAVMKGQVSKLDSEEIEAVAEYISNL